MARGPVKIKPLHATIIADPKWGDPIGYTPTMKPVYRETTQRTRAKPKFDDKGERVWMENRLTGEKLYPKNKAEHYTHVREFFLESDGHGNIYKVNYKPPSEAEIRAAERAGKIEQMKEQLAEVFVDSGLSPEQLVQAALKNAQAQEATDAGTVETTPTAEEFPKNVGVALWELSNGDRIRGKKDEAIEKQAELMASVEEGSY